jgi:hypothetical protein
MLSDAHVAQEILQFRNHAIIDVYVLFHVRSPDNKQAIQEDLG